MHWSSSGLITQTVIALAFDPQSPTTLYAGSTIMQPAMANFTKR